MGAGSQTSGAQGALGAPCVGEGWRVQVRTVERSFEFRPLQVKA